jgi:hypothetical protein
MLQWILIENVIHYLRAMPESRKKYNLIAKRKGYNTAKIALARDILKVVYNVLKEKREFYS